MNVIITNRLQLRPFQTSDIPHIVQLLSTPDIAKTTLNIPYPYREEDARAWIELQEKHRATGAGYTFAITRRDDAQLLGAIDIRPQSCHRKAEIGYWIGVPYWGQGYATEAVQTIIRYGFEMLDLNRIYALHFTDNPASGRVMQKAGMTFEGILREDVLKGDTFRDHAIYAMLRKDWEKDSQSASGSKS
jgi:RimJ/RimL family protein N-acetyltransferase